MLVHYLGRREYYDSVERRSLSLNEFHLWESDIHSQKCRLTATISRVPRDRTLSKKEPLRTDPISSGGHENSLDQKRGPQFPALWVIS